LYSTANNQEGLSEKHLCKSCIDGEILFVAEVGFKFSILKKKNLTTSVTPFKYEKKIYDFYYSIDNNKFAFTTCPNNSYKQTIKVLNANGTPVVSATVNGVKTNNNGEAVLYLTKGGHSLSVVGGGASKSVNITVTQSATHTFTLNLSTNNGSSNIISGLKCGANVYYKIYGDTLEIYGSGDMYDYCYQFWRDYQDSITKVIIKNGVTNIGESAFNFYRLNSITIPASVTNIEDWAFSGCSSLTSVTIPNRVKRIGNNAFDNCHNLRTIIIPSSVTSIGDWAFSWCESLESITIPNSVTNIGRWAFEGCESLKSATIPASVTSMGQGLFKGCTSLASIKVDSNNKYYDSRNNCNAIIKTSTNTLLMGCKNTVIPNSITSIGARAFHSCDSLTSITIPTSVTSIGDEAFANCSNLTSIIIPRSITSISKSTFTGCFKLNSVTIPASVTSIGDGAFAFCNSLVSITIPEGVKSIGYRAFDYCPNLTSITIPVSLTSIGEQAFCNCDSLKNIYYVGTSSQWKSVSIGKYNYGITNATIHYNSTKSAASTSLNLNTKKTDLASVGDSNKPAYSREHLVPETEAILVVVEGSVDDYEITTESLLYIGQTTADENGYASVDVPQDFSSYNAVALIFGDCDHSSSLWSMSVEPTFGEKALNVCICDYCENVIDTEDLTFLGDVDISGQVDIMDATRIQQHIALLSSIDDKALIYADSSRDGVVSIMDATLVQMYIAQLVAEF
ncbi:MAG: leucine-rich repeat protein, partial [Ruminococcus sp.]|nr:leucine-rich repeat protein [Ruminococcus sp.]